jgi:hypothetical protein
MVPGIIKLIRYGRIDAEGIAEGTPSFNSETATAFSYIGRPFIVPFSPDPVNGSYVAVFDIVEKPPYRVCKDDLPDAAKKLEVGDIIQIVSEDECPYWNARRILPPDAQIGPVPSSTEASQSG